MSATESQNTKYKRMAKNAGMLYIRMLLTMAVTLYTSRVVLQTLGVDDFGIYSVVAGFVTMLGFLNSAMSSATQRFLSFELGKPGDKDMRGIFSMSLNIHVLIAVFVLVLGETVGLWFVRTQMTIPADRMFAAEWVFHFALLSFMVTIVSVPYNALIIAHERMSVFAWVSIIDVTLKLLIVFIDRKSTRLNSSHVRISYAVFCLKKKKIKEARELVYNYNQSSSLPFSQL